MAPPSWAYQVDNFIPSPDEELVCSICQAVFCDPVQSPCNHVFCRTCITKWLESNRNCPICRKRTTRSTLQEVVPLVKNMIMKLVLRCHNHERGCGESFSLESCESHIKDCAFELVQCKNKPCKLMFMKRDLRDHELNNCPHSYIHCEKCNLKISSRTPEAHNCIEELQKKLKDKTDKLKKNYQKIKKLKDELKARKDNDDYTSRSSSDDSLSTADIFFGFGNASNVSDSSSIDSASAASESDDFDDSVWVNDDNDNQALRELDDLSRIADQVDFFSRMADQAADESIEYPRASSPVPFDDSSVVVVDAAESNIEEDEPQIRRPAKRRLDTNLLDSTDEEDGNLDISPLPSRKRTWQLHQNSGTDSSVDPNSFEVAGPSFRSTADSSTSTNESSPTSYDHRYRTRSKLRSRSAAGPSTSMTVNANSGAISLNGNPVFERTISLLEQYNLESDPEWLPTYARHDADGSDIDLVDIPGHITSSDESSTSDLDSESSYEDAAEARTGDLLNSFYGSSESDSEWHP